MADDFEDIFDTENLSSGELRQLIHEILAGNNSVDAEDITIRVSSNGRVTLAGRVGTEQERRIAVRLVTDRLGLERVHDQLTVDPMLRAESPESATQERADEIEHESLLLGDRPTQEDDAANYLDPDEEGENDGTVDRTKSMEEGIPWFPPESPTPEGEEGTGVERDGDRDSY